MNSAFVVYEELSRSRRVLFTEAKDLLNSSYPTQYHSLIANESLSPKIKSENSCVNK